MEKKISPRREVRSFLMARDPSIDRRFRPRPERQVRLFAEIQEDEDDSGSVYSSYDESGLTEDTRASSVAATHNSASGVDDTALVYLRLRPVDKPSTTYTIAGNVLITGPSAELTSSSNNKNTVEKHYSFSEIFEGPVQQRDVYDKCIAHKIDTDDNFTVLTYGTSGSGKTYTLLGDDDRPGIIPRALEHIFTLYASNIYPQPAMKLEKARVAILDDQSLAKEMQVRRKLLSACGDLDLQHTQLQQTIRDDHAFETKLLTEISVLVWISFVEIYNESVYDLLAPSATHTSMSAPPRVNMKIVGNDGKVFVKGLTSVYVKSSLEALKLLRYGLQRVTYASTSINENSSRSHCIFFVDVLKYHRSGCISETSYKFCDLAGSERLDKTGNIGSRLKEAQRINTSLLVLGRCLDAANNNRKKSNEVIPIRESKLTMLLQAALLGKEKLTMIVNVTPTDAYYEENLNVLGFASIAKNIVFKQPVVKKHNSRYSFLTDYTKSMTSNNREQSEYIEQLLEENAFLRNELIRIKDEAETVELDLRAELNGVSEELDRKQESHAAELFKQEQDIRNELVDSFQKTLTENKKLFEQRLQQELDLQERSHKAKIAALKRQYEDAIEDLRDEFEDEKENLSGVSAAAAAAAAVTAVTTTTTTTTAAAKKRRTID